MAALPDGEAGKLPALERAATDERVASARHTALARGWAADDARLAEREALATGVEELASLAALWPATAGDTRRISAALVAAEPRAGQAAAGSRELPKDLRIPERTQAVRGPLDVYYYNHLTAMLGDSLNPEPALLARSNGMLAFEALNLVDGKRSVSDIRDRLTGRYEPVPLAEVAAWLDVLAKAGVIKMRGR
jgi:hypothetical protein